MESVFVYMVADAMMYAVILFVACGFACLLVELLRALLRYVLRA